MTSTPTAATPAAEIAAWANPNARAVERATRAARARAAHGRRRNIDPTTCERDYSAEELEFLGAIERYKRSSGRMFPTWSEVLEVVRDLGYQKPAAGPAPLLLDGGSAR